MRVFPDCLSSLSDFQSNIRALNAFSKNLRRDDDGTRRCQDRSKEKSRLNLIENTRDEIHLRHYSHRSYSEKTKFHWKIVCKVGKTAQSKKRLLDLIQWRQDDHHAVIINRTRSPVDHRRAVIILPQLYCLKGLPNESGRTCTGRNHYITTDVINKRKLRWCSTISPKQKWGTLL